MDVQHKNAMKTTPAFWFGFRSGIYLTALGMGYAFLMDGQWEKALIAFAASAITVLIHIHLSDSNKIS